MNGSGAAAAAAATATATAAYETGASSCVDAASKTMAAVARAGKVKVLTLFTIFFSSSPQSLNLFAVHVHIPNPLIHATLICRQGSARLFSGSITKQALFSNC